MKKSAYNHKQYIVRSNALRYLTEDKCKICETSSSSNECHHIDGDNTNNEMSNLVILCPMHHKLVHLSDFKHEHLRSNIPQLLINKYDKLIRAIDIIEKHFVL